MRRLIALIVAVLIATTAIGFAAPDTADAHWPIINKRARYVRGFTSSHRGLDIAAPYFATVLAAGPGRTVFAGWRRNCGGWQVYIRHANNRYTAYYHMARETSYVGERISTGEAIGKVGSTGVSPKGIRMRCSTGPHLHLELWVGFPWRRGSYRINPRTYVMHRRNNPRLPARYR